MAAPCARRIHIQGRRSHMTSTEWNPWKMTAIGLGLVVAAALIPGVVVENWSGHEGTKKVVTSAATTKTPHVAAAQVAPAAVVAPPVGLPSQAVIDACNQ